MTFSVFDDGEAACARFEMLGVTPQKERCVLHPFNFSMVVERLARLHRVRIADGGFLAGTNLRFIQARRGLQRLRS